MDAEDPPVLAWADHWLEAYMLAKSERELNIITVTASNLHRTGVSCTRVVRVCRRFADLSISFICRLACLRTASMCGWL